MSADEARWKLKEVPFGPRSLQHVVRRQAELGEDLGDFVHEGDVDVRCAFSITFAASAVLIDRARGTSQLSVMLP